MTLEQHLRNMIGDLVLQVATLRAEVDDLKEQAEKPPTKPPTKDEPKS